MTTPEDLRAIRAKLEGGAFFTCCTHPDIDNSGYGPDSQQRKCVIDQGNAEACEMSSDDRGADQVVDKLRCPFWRPRQFKRPQRPTIAESLALLSAAEQGARAEEALSGCEADALRYRYLRERCSSHYAMTYEQPAEWSIQWEFQQHTPNQRWGSIDGWIDADIAALDDEDRAALLPQSPSKVEEG